MPRTPTWFRSLCAFVASWFLAALTVQFLLERTGVSTAGGVRNVRVLLALMALVGLTAWLYSRLAPRPPAFVRRHRTRTRTREYVSTR